MIVSFVYLCVLFNFAIAVKVVIDGCEWPFAGGPIIIRVCGLSFCVPEHKFPPRIAQFSQIIPLPHDDEPKSLTLTYIHGQPRCLSRIVFGRHLVSNGMYIVSEPRTAFHVESYPDLFVRDYQVFGPTWSVPYECRVLVDRNPNGCGWTHSGTPGGTTSGFQCSRGCVGQFNCRQGIQVRDSEKCDFIDSESCNFDDETFPPDGDWTIISRECFPDYYQNGIDYLPHCQYDGDADLCDPPRADCRAATCVEPACGLHTNEQSRVSCMLPRPPTVFKTEECENVFITKLLPILNNLMWPRCDRLTDWRVCNNHVVKTAHPEAPVHKVASAPVKVAVMIADTLIGKIPVVGDIIKGALKGYALLRGCTDWSCTEEECDANCFFSRMTEYVDQTIAYKIEEHNTKFFEGLVVSAELLLRSFALFTPEDQISARGKAKIDALDSLLTHNFGCWLINVPKNDAGLLYFMRFSQIHMLVKRILFAVYPTKSTLDGWIFTLTQYIDFVEKQNALAINRRVEGAIEVEYQSGTSWGDNQHEAHFAIKDNLCPEQQAKVFAGWNSAMYGHECDDGFLKTYAEALAKFCAYEYQKKYVETVEHDFWFDEVGNTVVKWKEIQKLLESFDSHKLEQTMQNYLTIHKHIRDHNFICSPDGNSGPSPYEELERAGKFSRLDAERNESHVASSTIQESFFHQATIIILLLLFSCATVLYTLSNKKARTDKTPLLSEA